MSQDWIIDGETPTRQEMVNRVIAALLNAAADASCGEFQAACSGGLGPDDHAFMRSGGNFDATLLAQRVVDALMVQPRNLTEREQRERETLLSTFEAGVLGNQPTEEQP